MKKILILILLIILVSLTSTPVKSQETEEIPTTTEQTSEFNYPSQQTATTEADNWGMIPMVPSIVISIPILEKVLVLSSQAVTLLIMLIVLTVIIVYEIRIRKKNKTKNKTKIKKTKFFNLNAKLRR